MSGSTFRRCPHGSKCPDLRKRHHEGSWFWADRLPTAESGGRELVKRGGFELERQAQAALNQVHELMGLDSDPVIRAKIGDLIRSSTMHGGQLPPAEDVRRRLALGSDPAGTGETFGQAWDDWLAGKKRLRAGTRRAYAQIGDQWLKPALAGVPVERLNARHCAMVFGRIEEINEQITEALDDGRAPAPDGDVRTRPQVIGVATQHRIYSALRAFLNYLWKKRHVITFNPVYAVELEPEETPEGQRWTAAEALRFLGYTQDKPLGLLFRTVVLRGARRGEVLGFRWAGADLDASYATVDRTVLQHGGAVVEGRAKSRAGERRVYLDAETVRRYRHHRKDQLAERLRASTAWEDNDLIFCRADGSPWPPDQVSRLFKRYAREAGVPVIKLHEGRHSAASLARDAGIDAKIRQEQLGHATGAMTDRYTHVLADAHIAAAEAVARYVSEAGA
jgi:integrase